MFTNCYVYDSCNHKDCAKDFCIRKYKLDYLYNNSLLSEPQRKYMPLYIDKDGTDLEEFKKLAEIQQNIVGFVKDGKSLYLHSTTTGVGKTSWAIRMIQAYFNKIWSRADLSCKALFISVPRFLLAIKDNISEKSEYVEFIKQNIIDADLVVWDDIFYKSVTDFEYSQLLSFIDSRIALNKANIYTSNLDRDTAYKIADGRLVSRAINFSIDIELHGADKRNFGGNN